MSSNADRPTDDAPPVEQAAATTAAVTSATAQLDAVQRTPTSVLVSYLNRVPIGGERSNAGRHVLGDEP